MPQRRRNNEVSATRDRKFAKNCGKLEYQREANYLLNRPSLPGINNLDQLCGALALVTMRAWAIAQPPKKPTLEFRFQTLRKG